VIVTPTNSTVSSSASQGRVGARAQTVAFALMLLIALTPQYLILSLRLYRSGVVVALLEVCGWWFFYDPLSIINTPRFAVTGSTYYRVYYSMALSSEIQKLFKSQRKIFSLDK